jgi:hypothetical protein
LDRETGRLGAAQHMGTEWMRLRQCPGWTEEEQMFERYFAAENIQKDLSDQSLLLSPFLNCPLPLSLVR